MDEAKFSPGARGLAREQGVRNLIRKLVRWRLVKKLELGHLGRFLNTGGDDDIGFPPEIVRATNKVMAESLVPSMELIIELIDAASEKAGRALSSGADIPLPAWTGPPPPDVPKQFVDLLYNELLAPCTKLIGLEVMTFSKGKSKPVEVAHAVDMVIGAVLDVGAGFALLKVFKAADKAARSLGS